MQPYSEMTLYSCLALRALGRAEEATALLQGLQKYAIELEGTPAKIDYFATSLPTMLLFSDDLDQRQRTRALFLQARL